MKRLISYFLFLICPVLLCGCASVTADFNWTPTNPKAGESVYFRNLSNDGEKWEWSFGDGTTPSTKTNPTKIFKKPGEYNVSLRVDGKNSWTTSHLVTVTDTLPYFSLSDSTGLYYYQKNTFSLVLYNPYSYSYTMQWQFPDSTIAHITLDTINHKNVPIIKTDTGQVAYYKTVTVYFSVHDKPVHVSCTVNMFKDDSTKIMQTYVIDTIMTVQDVKARSLLMETEDQKLYRQRIYDLGLEAYTLEKTYRALPQQDSVRDVLNNKLYYVSGTTLYCANADGSNPQVVVTNALKGTICLDSKSNQLYWGTLEGVMYGHLATPGDNKVSDISVFADGLVVKALELDEEER